MIWLLLLLQTLGVVSTLFLILAPEEPPLWFRRACDRYDIWRTS